LGKAKRNGAQPATLTPHRRGDELANLVLKSLQNATPLRSNALVFKSQPVRIPLANKGFRLMARLRVIAMRPTKTITTEVAYFRIGDMAFATHPGETCPDMSLETKAMIPGDGPKMVIGLGMDALGYILKPTFFAPDNQIPHSGYLCSVSVGPQAKDCVMEALRTLIK
jgi:hypothetical protein